MAARQHSTRQLSVHVHAGQGSGPAKGGNGKTNTKPNSRKSSKGSSSDSSSLRDGEVAVVAEPFSIDKCLNLYASILRWMNPFKGGQADKEAAVLSSAMGKAGSRKRGQPASGKGR